MCAIFSPVYASSWTSLPDFTLTFRAQQAEEALLEKRSTLHSVFRDSPSAPFAEKLLSQILSYDTSLRMCSLAVKAVAKNRRVTQRDAVLSEIAYTGLQFANS